MRPPDPSGAVVDAPTRTILVRPYGVRPTLVRTGRALFAGVAGVDVDGRGRSGVILNGGYNRSTSERLNRRVMNVMASLVDDQRSARVNGAVLGSAIGDALGAPYEFRPPLARDEDVVMSGGGSFAWAPGEWTDDTSMAIPILHAIARGQRPTRVDGSVDDAVLGSIVRVWVAWAQTAPDVGNQTRSVLERVRMDAGAAAESAQSARNAGRILHERTGRSGGNGSLMRTAPIALAYLDDPAGLAVAARAISDLTHVDHDAGDACVLWSLAIRHAILTAEFSFESGLAALPAERVGRWRALIGAAEAAQPWEFPNNGWVVTAFQAAWSAIAQTSSFPEAAIRAVRCGNDTDTVAAIAGGLAGARYGLVDAPADWLDLLHGWPGASGSREFTGTDLAVWAQAAVLGDPTDVPHHISPNGLPARN